MEPCVRATEVRVTSVRASRPHCRHHCLTCGRERQSICVALTLVGHTTARGRGQLEGVEVQPHPADVLLALGDRVGQRARGGRGHVVARVARVDDVRRVLGDRRPAGGDREDTADSEAGGAVAKNRAALARALRAGQTGPGKD